MGRIKRIELSQEARTALEAGYREGANHAYRRRCHMILLKSEGRSSAQVAQVLGGCEVVVNTWLRRCQEQGLAGLQTRSGRGRPPILDAQTDLERVRQAVADNRQRLAVVKAELQEALGKQFSQDTLTRFVKKTVRCINDCESVHARSQTRTFTSLRSNASKS